MISLGLLNKGSRLKTTLENFPLLNNSGQSLVFFNRPLAPMSPHKWKNGHFRSVIGPYMQGRPHKRSQYAQSIVPNIRPLIGCP